MLEFYKTQGGRRFVDATLPKIAQALERIAEALEKLAEVKEQPTEGGQIEKG